VQVLQRVYDTETGARVEMQRRVADGREVDQDSLAMILLQRTAVLTASVVAPLPPFALMTVKTRALPVLRVLLRAEE